MPIDISEVENEEDLPEGIIAARILLPYFTQGDDMQEHLKACCLSHAILAHAERMDNAARMLKELFLIINQAPDEIRVLTCARANGFVIVIIGPEPLIEGLIEQDLAEPLDEGDWEESGGGRNEEEDSDEDDEDDSSDDESGDDKKGGAGPKILGRN